MKLPTIARLFLNVAVFAVAFAGAVLVLAAALPMAEMTNITSKHRYLAAHREEIDVLFIGSSQFFHQIIPREFDAAVTAATGRKVRSFNFGISGMWPPESFQVLRGILALRPPHLRWVFVELMDIDLRDVKAAGITRRLVSWHDELHTRMVNERIEEAVPEAERDSLQRSHIVLRIRRALNLGRCSDYLIGKMTKNNFGREKSWGKEMGYSAGDADDVAEGARLETYSTALAAWKSAGPAPAMPPALARGVRELAAAIREAGATPIFVSSPSVDLRHRFTGLDAGAELWLFNEPEKYPELFDAEVRVDVVHLTPVGAGRFTKVLGERFVQRWKAAE